MSGNSIDRHIELLASARAVMQAIDAKTNELSTPGTEQFMSMIGGWSAISRLRSAIAQCDKHSTWQSEH